MAKLTKKELEYLRRLRQERPSERLNNLIIEFTLDPSTVNKQNIADELIKNLPESKDYFERQELYRLINREKAKIRYRERDIDYIRRTLSNRSGLNIMNNDYALKYEEWIKMNIRNDFSRMSIQDLNNILEDMQTFNKSTKFHNDRIDLVLRGKLLQYLISKMLGASDEKLAEMIETTVQYIMKLTGMSKPEALEFFEDNVDEMEDNFN